LFAGLGAQAKGFERTDLFDLDVVATADLDKEVNVSYAAIHCGLTPEMVENYDQYPSKEEMVKEMTEKRIGYDFKNNKNYDWDKVAKKKDKMKGIEKYWLAMKLANNLGDVAKIEHLPETDVLFFSSPCTDFSIAGQQVGSDWTCLDCETKYNPLDYDLEHRYNCPNCNSTNILSTRSGTLVEVERLLVDYKERGCLPKFLILENVPALVSKKFINFWNAWVERLDNLGYTTRWQLINAKDCGIPQNRNRIFAISFRNDIDADKFNFPEPFELKLRLKDILEDEVDEKYYLNTDRAKDLIQRLIDEGKLPEKECL